MKKNTFILMAMTAMFGLSSCDKELFPVEDNNNENGIIYAYTESDATKTALSWNDQEGHYDVVWSEGDQFTVFSYTTPDNKCVFTLTDGDAGKTSGTFVGEKLDPSAQYIAYYPVNENFKDIQTWPTNQTYHGENYITGCPMISSIFRGSDKSVTFTNLGGILRLTVKNTESVSISKITVCADELESPITLDCSNGGSGVAFTADSVEFNIAMPSNGNEPASYSNVSIYLTDTNGKVCCKSLKSGVKLDIVRSKITNAPFSVNSKDFYSSTTGSKVTFGGHEGIVVNINGKKVIVATMNVGATTVYEDDCLGDKMNYDEACAAWSGWRLPTVNELTAFCDPFYPAYGDFYGAAGCTGAVMWDIDRDEVIDLYLPLSDNDEDGNPIDIYWTGTPGSNGTYYYFAPAIEFDGDYAPLNPEWIRKDPADKNDTYLVRLFHDLP